MNLFYSDFDKRFLNALAPRPSTRHQMTDAQVLREMAEVWVQSGGDAGGLTDEYVRRLRAEIARVEKGAV
jgi:hypothetical protein